MVILGKTRMTEFAFGLSGQNGTQGTARNPWDAVQARARAARPAARPWPWPRAGADRAGRRHRRLLRAPAALNGLVGYKPSTGLISRAGSLPLSDTLDVLGPIARNVADARALAVLLSGPDVDDAATLALPPGVTALRHPETRAPGPLAVLAPEAWPAALGEASLALWRHTLDQLAAAGHTPQTWTPSPGLSFDRMAEDNSLVLAYEAYRYYGALAEDPAQPLWTVVRSRIAAGGRIRQADYEAALQRRDADMAAYARAMQGHDALLMPACDQAAQPLDAADLRHAGLGKSLRPANFLGAAAISLPAGLMGKGCRSGAAAGAGGEDAALMDCAAAVEGCWGWRSGGRWWGLGGCRDQEGRQRGCGVWATGNLPPRWCWIRFSALPVRQRTRASAGKRHFSFCCLCGSERVVERGTELAFFLSCLCGSERRSLGRRPV